MPRNLQPITLKTNRGFTLVELIITIVVIAVLATIAVLGTTHVLKDSRDSQRAASVATLAEALEKYYDENGEYPSCPLITSDAATISNELDVDQAALTMPGNTSDNSLTCSDITIANEDDVLAYVGDGSTQCQTGQACVSFTLKYKGEASGQIETLKSRRTGTVATAPAAPASVVSASLSGSTATGTAGTVSCSDATPQYRLGTRTNAGAWSMGSWQSGRTVSIAAAEGSQYGFKAETRCTLPDGTIGNATTSNVANVTRAISAPSTPVVAATSTGSGTADSVTWSWPAVTCPSGTSAEYSSAYFRDDTTAWRDWSAVTTSRSYTVATNYQGYQYQVKAKARCKSSYATSNYSSDSNTVSYIRNVNAPGIATGFNIEKKTNNASSGGGTYETSRIWWDNTPTCGPGTSHRLQIAGWANSIRGAGINGGGGGTYIFQTDTSVPQSNYQQSAPNGVQADFNRQEYRYRTAWESVLTPAFKNAADAPDLSETYYWKTWVPTSAMAVSAGTSVSALDGTHYKLRGTRIYVRYACINTTTERFAIGEPSLSSWKAWY